MLYECNIPKLIILKYLPLFIAIIFLADTVVNIPTNQSNSWINSIIPVVIAVILIAIFLFVKDKLKYVAIGKIKIIIKKKGKAIEHGWLDVESITLNRFWGLYNLKIKGEAEIYFTAYGLVTWLTGDESDMGVIINKMKKELQI
jgi:hypothetical protein